LSRNSGGAPAAPLRQGASSRHKKIKNKKVITSQGAGERNDGEEVSGGAASTTEPMQDEKGSTDAQDGSVEQSVQRSDAEDEDPAYVTVPSRFARKFEALVQLPQDELHAMLEGVGVTTTKGNKQAQAARIISLCDGGAGSAASEDYIGFECGDCHCSEEQGIQEVQEGVAQAEEAREGIQRDDDEKPEHPTEKAKVPKVNKKQSKAEKKAKAKEEARLIDEACAEAESERQRDTAIALKAIQDLGGDHLTGPCGHRLVAGVAANSWCGMCSRTITSGAIISCRAGRKCENLFMLCMLCAAITIRGKAVEGCEGEGTQKVEVAAHEGQNEEGEGKAVGGLFPIAEPIGATEAMKRK
jgi:hypothetical protein